MPWGGTGKVSGPANILQLSQLTKDVDSGPGGQGPFKAS